MNIKQERAGTCPEIWVKYRDRGSVVIESHVQLLKRSVLCEFVLVILGSRGLLKKTINEVLHWLPPWQELMWKGRREHGCTESWGSVSACVWRGHYYTAPYLRTQLTNSHKIVIRQKRRYVASHIQARLTIMYSGMLRHTMNIYTSRKKDIFDKLKPSIS